MLTTTFSTFKLVFREGAVHGSLAQLTPSEINAKKVKLCKFHNRRHVKFSLSVDETPIVLKKLELLYIARLQKIEKKGGDQSSVYLVVAHNLILILCLLQTKCVFWHSFEQNLWQTFGEIRCQSYECSF